MNSRQRRTLERLFRNPPPSDIRWAEVESLLVALGVRLEQGSGSRVSLTLDRERLVVHTPHPEPTIGKKLARSLARFLRQAGVTP